MIGDLDSYEQQIEDEVESYDRVSKKGRDKIESLLEKERKTKNINIRISEFDLSKIRHISSQEGIPYQTLIASIIHKYVTNQLVEEKSILKVMQLMKK